MSINKKQSIIRNLVFGIQDSFGSTVGFLSGVAVSDSSRETLLFTGILLVFVEAFSMATGSLLSEHTVEEVDRKRSLPILKSLTGPIVMFIAYAVSGMIPLLPYLLFWGAYSLPISIALSMTVLGIFGYISAVFYKINPKHHIIETLIISSLAIGVGIAIGKLLPQ